MRVAKLLAVAFLHDLMGGLTFIVWLVALLILAGNAITFVRWLYATN